MSDLICSNCQREIDKIEFLTCPFCNASICMHCFINHCKNRHQNFYTIFIEADGIGFPVDLSRYGVDKDSLELELLRDAGNPNTLLLREERKLRKGQQ